VIDDGSSERSTLNSNPSATTTSVALVRGAINPEGVVVHFLSRFKGQQNIVSVVGMEPGFLSQ